MPVLVIIAHHAARSAAVGPDPVTSSSIADSMSNDAFYRPNLPPLPPRAPRPGEPLWTLRKDRVTWSAELRYHGEWGVEAQILRDGDLSIAQRFDLRELAARWADDQRQLIERGFAE